jgi:hypothetical protein
MQIVQEYLPPEHRKRVLKKSKKFYSSYALKTANRLWNHLHDKKVTLANVKEGLHMQKNIPNFLKTLKIYLKILLQRNKSVKS